MAQMKAITHSRTLCICRGCRNGLGCGVPSNIETPVGCRECAEVGLKSPGLDEGVLAAVLEVINGSIVGVKQCQSRHVGLQELGCAFAETETSPSTRHLKH